MTYKFSSYSLKQLSTCDPHLQLICSDVLEIIDISVICGHRDEESQRAVFESGHSKLNWPHGLHNKLPSRAVDIAPHTPYRKLEQKDFYFMAGVVFGIAHRRGIKLRWGGDWDRDLDFSDQRFYDLYHFELVV